MNNNNWKIPFGIALVLASVLLYGAHYLMFQDPHHIFIYLMGDIAFVPLEVLVVSMILHELLKRREKKAMMHKLNMAIGVFFSEMGSDLLRRFISLDADGARIKGDLTVNQSWSPQLFDKSVKTFTGYDTVVKADAASLEDLRGFLCSKRAFLLTLLENPNLLEHEKFTDLLWAVFHLTEELSLREDFGSTSQEDLQHLAGDAKRAYGELLPQWLGYMKHLQSDYPYLFSLAVRTNPFADNSCVEVKKAA